MCHKQNRKSVKGIIADALLILLKKKLFINITVTELVDVAQVSRASFYRNYNSIDDVLAYIVDEIYIELINKLTPSMLSYRQDKWYEAAVRLFQYIYEVKDRFFKIESENSSYILNRLKNKYELNAYTNDSSKVDSYLASALIGIIYALADKWRNEGYTDTPETIALVAVKIIDPILLTWDSKFPSVL